MRHTFILPILISGALIAGTAAQAACYADYKAKRDNPLRLHYGVIELDDAMCEDRQAIKNEIQSRIGADNWTLLNVLGAFDADGLEERKDGAGKFYLRF